MICPHCQTENPPGSKFCNECGQRLIAKCPTCGRENAPGSKFCNECGTRLGPASPADPRGVAGTPIISQPPPSPLSNLEALIPQDFAAKLETARTQKTMVGERRVVTMLFCDVKGSTAAAGQLDPEDWAQIMNGVFEHMIRPVYKYEGTVARLMGDAILAFFGAPVAHEDDPQRAILAGLEIAEGFAPYRGKVQHEWGVEIDVRVGINTGLVMVGAVGSDLQMEYTALGDAINLAARMEQTAVPGTVQVSDETYKLAAPIFEWMDLGTVEVKGKLDPIQTYRPLRQKTTSARLRGIEGLNAPMVGRDDELDHLTTAVQRLEQGVGSIIFVTGEAGLGKSRLIRELRNTEYRIRPAFHETVSFSYEISQPYAIFQRLLRRACGVEEGDSPLEMWEKFLPILNLIPADVPDQGGVFETLFAYHGPSSAPVPEGEAFKRQLFDLMERIWRQWTTEAPRVLIFDDLHWTDPASVDLLIHLFKLADTCPVVILCATRPDRETPGWAAKQTAAKAYPHRFLDLHLRPLTATDTNDLVDKLLTISDLPAKLRARILEKTDGNPFFIEEVVRTMIDNGLVVRETNGSAEVHWRAVKHIEDIEIPGNLQSLLIARIDKLEDSARRTLQLASVIGRSFYFRVLDTINRTVAIVQDQLDDQLLTLQRAELIREAARLPELEYIFKHALTQEAAYSTILHRQRREFHRQVGEAIENLFPDRADEFASLLAHHFGEANDPRAGRYESLAGDAAYRLYAIPEAISHYARALEIVKREKVRGPDSTRLFNRLGRCYELQSNYAEALRVYEELTQMAKHHGDAAMELEAAILQGKVYAVPNNFQNEEKAQAFSERALDLARSLGDLKAEARIHWNFQLLKMYTGKMDEGIPYGERAIELARGLGMQDIQGHALQDLSLAYMAVGELARSRSALEEATPIWTALGNLPMLVENYSNRSYERIMAGDFEAAIRLSEQGFALAEKIQNQWGQVNSQIFTSQVYLALGNIDKVNEIQAYCIPLARSVGHPGSALVLIQRAWMFTNIGNFEKANEAADEAVKDAVAFAPFYAYAMALRAWYHMRDGEFLAAEALMDKSGKIVGHNKTLIEINIIFVYVRVEWLLAKGNLEQALKDVGDLIEFVERSGVLFFLPESLLLKAKIQQASGQMEAQYETLLQARDVAQTINFRTQQLRIAVALAQVAEQGGDTDQADAFRAEVQPVIQFIADHMHDAKLQEVFRQYVVSVGLVLAP